MLVSGTNEQVTFNIRIKTPKYAGQALVYLGAEHYWNCQLLFVESPQISNNFHNEEKASNDLLYFTLNHFKNLDPKGVVVFQKSEIGSKILTNAIERWGGIDEQEVYSFYLPSTAITHIPTYQSEINLQVSSSLWHTNNKPNPKNLFLFWPKSPEDGSQLIQATYGEDETLPVDYNELKHIRDLTQGVAIKLGSTPYNG